MAKGEIYDVLIVGGGHAGLSAALTLYRQLHSVLIFDINKPRNAWNFPTHIVTGWEGQQAEELRATARAELAATGLVTILDREARAVQQTKEGFEIQDEQGGSWKGRKLLLAAGKRNVFPDIPGFADHYPERM
jgi:gliotoxin/aspirochlorine biosynthesis thioredoxin reductase